MLTGNESEPNIGLIVVCLFPIFFLIMWNGVVLLLAVLGGWSRLAQYYQVRSAFEGTIWRFKSGRMGLTNYRGCLSVGANDYGLYLAVLPFFRLGHPALFIPWEDITTSPSKSFFISYLDFRFSRSPSVTLKVPEKLGETILTFRPDFISGGLS